MFQMGLTNFAGRAAVRAGDAMDAASHAGPPESVSAAAAPTFLSFCPTGLLIGGRFVPAAGGRAIGVEDPATGRVLAMVADASERDCRDALDAAVAAQASWGASSPQARSRVLRRAGERLRDDAEICAQILTAEMGKPLSESRDEVAFAATYLEWFADEAMRIGGRIAIAPDGRSQHLVTRGPVGPSLIITPWNFPLVVPARGVGAAIAAGCTVVLRPSSLTPLSALALGRILVEAGLPAGVLNVVVSSEDEATDPLLTDGRIRKLTFTGSRAVGRHLTMRAAEKIVRVSTELGGCAPFLVFSDADLDEAVAGALEAKLRNGGAACTAANRFYVQRPVHEEFTRRLAARLEGVRMARGTRVGVGLGPMISRDHVTRLAELVEDAVGHGAHTIVPGGPVPGDGHFFVPVILADVPRDARVMREEIFGPIIAIAPFDTDDEALSLANDHDAGLAAYLYTRDLDRALRFGGAIEAGMIAVNRGRVSCATAPFGGVGLAGNGQSGGSEGIEEYLATRYVTLPVGSVVAA